VVNLPVSLTYTVPALSYNTVYVWGIASVAALGGLLFGYDWVVIGGAKPFYEAYFDLTSPQLIGWANSCALVGCLLGSIVCSALTERLGRRKLLVLAALLFAVSSLCTALAHGFSTFVIWRITGGIAIGIASNVSPTYIAEISPAPWRGQLVALNQLTIVVGILAAQIVNWLIAQPVADGVTMETLRHSWNGQWGWRWMFMAVAVPSIVFFVSAFLVPESPRWLANRGLDTAARRILARIGGEDYAAQELREIRATINQQGQSSVWAGFRAPGVSGVLVTGIGLAVLQQWSGINIIFNYAEELYRQAGYGINGALVNIMITGTVNLVFTVFAMGCIDRFGRRTLLLWGCAGIALAHALLGVAYATGLGGIFVLTLTLAAIGSYAMSLAPVTWVVISEIFPNRIRGQAVSVAVSALWIANFALTFTFPLLSQLLKTAGTFWLYSVICLAGLLFILLRVPETKGKTLEQIEQDIARAA
jgi:SP family xylose:H+ symportor-like MFS transporter